MAAGAWGASEGNAGAASQESQTLAVKSETRCYATTDHPDVVVCYRISYKAEFRHRELVYVPRLIQVPTPPHPPSVALVKSLSDIRPA
jgi:hypothetical protein